MTKGSVIIHRLVEDFWLKTVKFSCYPFKKLFFFSEEFFIPELQQLLVSHATAVAGMTPGSSHNQVEPPSCVAWQR